MTQKMSLRRSRKDYWPVLAAGAGLSVIIAWLLFGSTGLFAWGDYHRAIQIRQHELAGLKVEQSRLVNRQRLLDPRRVDPDLVDETLRGMNLIHPDDIVIPLN